MNAPNGMAHQKARRALRRAYVPPPCDWDAVLDSSRELLKDLADLLTQYGYSADLVGPTSQTGGACVIWDPEQNNGVRVRVRRFPSPTNWKPFRASHPNQPIEWETQPQLAYDRAELGWVGDGPRDMDQPFTAVDAMVEWLLPMLHPIEESE